MEETSLLKQQIEFLEIQLKDFQQREQSLKSHFESVISSVLAVTSPNITQEYALKVEDLKKNHSNELLILKFFYKQRVDILQEKLTKLKNVENKEMLKLRLEKESIEAQLKEHSFENQQLRVHQKFLEGKLENSQYKAEEIEKIKERFFKKRDSWKLKKEILKEETIKTKEKMKKNLDEIKSFYQSNSQLANLKALETLIEKLKSCLQEISKQSTNSDRLQHFKYFMHEIDSKLLKIISTLDSTENTSESSTVLTVKNRNSLNTPQTQCRLFTFASPLNSKNNENLSTLADTCKKFPSNASLKPPVHSPTHKRAHTLTNLTQGPFTFQYSDRLSLQDTSDSIRPCKNTSKINQLNLETVITHLKIQLAKVKNQRDKCKIENDKILLELKDSKLNLAVEKEKHGERMIVIENENKKIAGLVKAMPEGLENFQREIARSVFQIAKTLS